jgi:hypothetical protein
LTVRIYQGEPRIFGRLVPRSDSAPQRSSAPKSPFGISRRILQRMHVLERTPLSRAPCMFVASESGCGRSALTMRPASVVNFDERPPSPWASRAENQHQLTPRYHLTCRFTSVLRQAPRRVRRETPRLSRPPRSEPRSVQLGPGIAGPGTVVDVSSQRPRRFATSPARP